MIGAVKSDKKHVFQLKFSHFKILKILNALILVKTTHFNDFIPCRYCRFDNRTSSLKAIVD
jgi:hypothetical protein